MQVMGVGPLWFDGSVSMQHNGYGVGMSIRPASRVRDARQVNFQPRRGGRAVECTGLENRRWSDPTVGSNPTLSANAITDQPVSLPVFLSRPMNAAI
jgi:hypothetical protein